MNKHEIQKLDGQGQVEQSLGLSSSIQSLDPSEAPLLYQVLEHPNWAPWLEAGEKTIEGRAKVFPAGQLVMKDANGVMIASLSLNQINWDGNPETLPSWDEVAGDPTDYSKTYTPQGNTLVLLSMNVHPEQKGKQLPSKMIDAAVELAKTLQVQHLIGSFRPSGYGKAKQVSDTKIPFWEYCQTKRVGSDKPIDPWLGSLWHKGMQMLKPDNKAMVVEVGFAQFQQYQADYHPDQWTSKNLLDWECGEVGSWITDPDDRFACYIESNVWGYLPID